MENFTIRLINDDDISDTCGTKATMLQRIKRIGIEVPEFYGVEMKDFLKYYESASFDELLAKEQNPRKYNGIMIEEIPEGKYIVRSSAVPYQKDNPEFASMISGAFESYVAKSNTELGMCILKVWESVFSTKAREQCELFLEKASVAGMGVLVQRYIHPVISGVLHSGNNVYKINWIKGHLSEIVQGISRGNNIICFENDKHETILRGVEDNILKTIEYTLVMKQLVYLSKKIVDSLGYEVEIEWIYDGQKVWIVQCQKLIGAEGSCYI